MSRITFAKASKYLSSEQIKELQDQGLEGMQIYAPPRVSQNRPERINDSGHLHDSQGLSLAQIADRLQLSPRRVAAIVKEFRERSKEEK